MYDSGTKVSFIKSDVMLWPSRHPWIDVDVLSQGCVLALPSGREISFVPSVDGRCLKADRDCTGYAEWIGIKNGEVVEAEVV